MRRYYARYVPRLCLFFHKPEQENEEKVEESKHKIVANLPKIKLLKR